MKETRRYKLAYYGTQAFIACVALGLVVGIIAALVAWGG